MNIQKALVIDDSKVAHLTLRKLLTEQGIDVDWVESGEDGIAYLKRQRPDVVFMDIMMPGMDGFETIGAINQDSAIVAPPIVMCSANATDEDRHNAKQNGAIAFLSKPYTTDELNQSLDQVRALAAPTAALPHPAAVEQPAVSTSTESHLIAKAAEKAAAVARDIATEVTRATAEQVIRSALQKTGRAIQEALKDTAIKAARTTAEEAARVVAERVAREVSEGVAARAISTLSQDGARRDLDEIREGLAKELEVQLSRSVQEALAHAMAGGEFRQRLSTLVEPTARQAAAQTAREVAIQALAEAAPPRADEIAGQTAGRHAKLALAAGFAAVIISVVVGVLF